MLGTSPQPWVCHDELNGAGKYKAAATSGTRAGQYSRSGIRYSRQGGSRAHGGCRCSAKGATRVHRAWVGSWSTTAVCRHTLSILLGFGQRSLLLGLPDCCEPCCLHEFCHHCISADIEGNICQIETMSSYIYSGERQLFALMTPVMSCACQSHHPDPALMS